MTNFSLTLALIMTLACGVLAQELTTTTLENKGRVEASKAIALPADVAGQVKDLRAAFETIQTQKELIMAREKNIQALLAVQFNRACAKLKVDPDLYEWTEDLSGIRPKTPPKK